MSGEVEELKMPEELTESELTEVQEHLKKVFASFSDEFKQLTVMLLYKKMTQRIPIVKKHYSDKNELEVRDICWAEVALESTMILADALNRKNTELEDLKKQIGAIAHLMPANTSSRKQ